MIRAGGGGPVDDCDDGLLVVNSGGGCSYTHNSVVTAVGCSLMMTVSSS